MMLHRNRLIAAAIVVTVGFVIAGCGSSGSSGGAGSTSAPTTAPATTTVSTTPPAAAPIKVSADPGGQLAFVEKTLTAPAGKSTIELTNASQVPHNIEIEGNGKDLGPTETISGGGKTTLSIDLPAGNYVYFCAVPGHRQAGMTGKLTVG